MKKNLNKFLLITTESQNIGIAYDPNSKGIHKKNTAKDLL